MTFQEYLRGKKINPDAFEKAEPARWLEWKSIFEQMHPNSFTLQKLNLINRIRRKYIWKGETTPTAPLPSIKPKIVKPKIN